MYSNHRLDTPPPSSRLRRPWSPDPYDPLPSVSQHHQDEPAYYIPGQYAEQRREPSDASVEALDLADYSATLTRNNGNIHRPLPFHAYDPYPPSPPPLRPLASSESLHPPSLVSPSASSLHSLASSTSRAPIRRPFSLPAPSYPQRSLQSHPPLSNHTHAWPEPRIQSPDNDEIDIAHFPSFTHAWYEGGNAHTRLSPPPSACDAKLSPFDPAYPTHAYDYSPYAHSPPPSYPSRSSRDLATVPWGAGSTESGAPIDPGLKEERMRMLEREFGGKGVGQGEKDEDEDGEKVGGVDAKGRLITQGPKKRLAVRMLQALVALLAAVSSIYAAAVCRCFYDRTNDRSSLDRLSYVNVSLIHLHRSSSRPARPRPQARCLPTSSTSSPYSPSSPRHTSSSSTPAAAARARRRKTCHTRRAPAGSWCCPCKASQAARRRASAGRRAQAAAGRACK